MTKSALNHKTAFHLQLTCYQKHSTVDSNMLFCFSCLFFLPSFECISMEDTATNGTFRTEQKHNTCYVLQTKLSSIRDVHV